MNRDTDYAEFSALLLTTMSVYGKQVTGDLVRLYFNALQALDLAAVKDALNRHVQDPEGGQFPPKPADLIKQVQGVKADDGRPGRDEAWAIAMRATDEQDTVLVTDEILGGLFVAKPLLDVRDKVAARMAFIESYERLVDIARRQGRPGNWTVSLGDDKQRRTAAVEEGVRMGRLSRQQAEPHLLRIAQETQPISREGLAIAGLLAGPSTGKPLEVPEIRRRLAELKSGIGSSGWNEAERKHQQAVEVKADRDQRLAEHLKLIEELEGKRDD